MKEDLIEINSLNEFLDLAKEDKQMNKEEQALREYMVRFLTMKRNEVKLLKRTCVPLV